ncbi:hypothetical protein diail_8442 [Diaporthe ilicicola]|nr:hypothetical protein diail_8442 [Diaporthe ilicicola]
MSINTFGRVRASLALASLAAIVGAQDVCYPQVTSGTITECVPNTGVPKPTPFGAACPNPLHSQPNGGPITVAVPMPSCQECGCATCVHANVYTTSFATFCPKGITTQVYVVKELYTGMPAAPSISQRPDVPMGFVQGVQTCHSCGPKPITTKLTYPVDGCPFVGGQTGPAPAPGGMPGWVVSPDKGGSGYTPSQDVAKVLLAAWAELKPELVLVRVAPRLEPEPELELSQEPELRPGKDRMGLQEVPLLLGLQALQLVLVRVALRLESKPVPVLVRVMPSPEPSPEPGPELPPAQDRMELKDLPLLLGLEVPQALVLLAHLIRVQFLAPTSHPGDQLLAQTNHPDLQAQE